MKPLSFFCFGLFALSAVACVSVEAELWQVPAVANANRLPPLEAVVELGPLYNTNATQPEELLELLQSELHQNLAEPAAPYNFGYARLLVTQAAVRRSGRVLQVVQLLTMLTPSLLGVPFETYRTTLTAKLQIVDAQGEIVGEYEGQGESKVRVAMYHGYSQRTAPTLSDAQALRLALARIRPQLDTAAGRLQPRLLAAGRVEQLPVERLRPVGQR
ncbi:hypothetical protein [Hymenobacter sp. IS2118]|uniref:hypothetical protein n=1 Tax=Hymenobacter sp. IS2118 TaxID=1505605 RepID=UPI00054DAFF4|nr:hypothetical protein [Hymenobacter sp. IS2118]